MAASRLVFIVQTVISLIVLGFGFSVWFTSSDANLKSVGSGFVAYVLGFWTKGYKSPNEVPSPAPVSPTPPDPDEEV